MQNWSDARLLREYAKTGSEAAFSELVARHTNLVYSAALRQVESPDVAADVAQRVFVGLAQGAGVLTRRLDRDASLAGWLCRSARNVCLNHRRDEFRRRSREGIAMENLNANASDATPDWEDLRSVLDDAMSELDEPDYDAVVLRYYQQQDFRAVGRALGISDDTAQKRVARALEKLRGRLGKRGVTMTAAALALALSAKAAHAAPAGLAASIASAATLAQSAAGTSTALTITKSILMTTLQKTLIAAALTAAIGTVIYEAHRAAALEQQSAALAVERDSLTRQLQSERDGAARELAAAQRLSASGTEASSGEHTEILRLRGQVGQLRAQLAGLQSKDADPASAEMQSWLDRVKLLKGRLAQNPKASIPEFQLLTDQDWLDAVRDVKTLQSDSDYDKAWRALREAALREFSGSIQAGLHGFAQANNGSLPGDFSQLQPYMTNNVDDSILQGYEFSQPGTVVSKSGSLIDQTGNYYYSQLKIGMDSVSSSTTTEDTLHQAIQAYMAANEGQTLTDPSQLLPYVNTLGEKTALQKVIQGRSSH